MVQITVTEQSVDWTFIKPTQFANLIGTYTYNTAHVYTFNTPHVNTFNQPAGSFGMN